jgi:UDPglucose--hexose-1-phosphate uridylyltransferase
MKKEIEQLIQYGLNNQMIEILDIPLVRNQLMALLQVVEPYKEASNYYESNVSRLKSETDEVLLKILSSILKQSVEKNLIEDTISQRDILDAKLMATMMPRQSELNRIYNSIRENNGVEAATDYYYHLSQASNYIRMDRIKKNRYWIAETDYGNLEITINLSKPEKDPKEIVAAKLVPQSNYPKCFLCLDNVGYEGRANHPARANHRVLPITLKDEQWYLQYSPYVYYNEHAIIFKGKHEPMRICKDTFVRLLDFVEQFPHYFIGSNADLPIVGGSILSHDHFQGGHHIFPMEVADIIYRTNITEFKGIQVSLIKWPLSVIRIAGSNKENLVNLSDHVLKSWQSYSDDLLDIIAYTEDTPHNTITPIARVNKEGLYEIDLVLRNNRQSETYPDGIFHPHKHLQHIKKENIGLIEVMGLAVLPKRLESELRIIAQILTGEIDINHSNIEIAEYHKPWISELIKRYGTENSEKIAKQVIEREVGDIFKEILSCAGVYKQDNEGIEGLKRFLEQL